jgi:chromosome segregation ATPase
VAQLRKWIAEFNAVGFVPFKEKDKIYKEFRAAVDKHFDRLKVHEADRKLQSFKSNLGTGEQSKNRLLSERDRLLRTYERIKADIQTYENNIGFLTSSSKKGNSLVTEVQRKIESLKGELELIEKKIKVTEESLGFGQ